MSGIFTILFLLSLVLLIWGLIAPHHFAKHAKDKTFTRKHAGLGFGFFVFIFLILVGVTSPSAKQKTVQLDATQTKVQQQVQKSSNTVTTSQSTETKPVAFTTQNQDDSRLPSGQTKILQTGKDGIETLTYNITSTNGTQTNKRLVSDVVTTQPVTQIVAQGTYVQPTPTAAPSTAVPSATTSTPSTTSSCHPLTNGGNCYEPGEYCRDSDHGNTGVAGDGKSIVCTNNNGWRWEPQ